MEALQVSPQSGMPNRFATFHPPERLGDKSKNAVSRSNENDVRARTLGAPTYAPLTVAVVQITGGPVKGELVTRILSNLPVTFDTTSGPITVLIEEAQETDPTRDRFSFVGRVVDGAQVGARVEGHYDCQGGTGTGSVTSNGQ
jgi:hypothetical protein